MPLLSLKNNWQPLLFETEDPGEMWKLFCGLQNKLRQALLFNEANEVQNIRIELINPMYSALRNSSHGLFETKLKHVNPYFDNIIGLSSSQVMVLAHSTLKYYPYLWIKLTIVNIWISGTGLRGRLKR